MGFIELHESTSLGAPEAACTQPALLRKLGRPCAGALANRGGKGGRLKQICGNSPGTTRARFWLARRTLSDMDGARGRVDSALLV
jgi:hypothetical protein